MQTVSSITTTINIKPWLMFFFLSLIKNYYSILIKSHKPAIIGIESAKNDKNVESFSKIIKVSTLLNESSFILCFFFVYFKRN